MREVMWDGIDCHKARQLGWTPVSWDDPDLRFDHLRPMGSSQQSIYTGRRRHGFGQYYMGTHPLFLIASAINKSRQRPYVLGGLAMIQGYFGAMLRREDAMVTMALLHSSGTISADPLKSAKPAPSPK